MRLLSSFIPKPMTIDSRKTLGVFTLAMLNVSAIVSLRNLPLMASHGLSSLFFYGIAALLFFIPCALTCAELATGWPKAGGIFAWATEAFGEEIGFMAVWLEWIESVVWLPAALSFVAATVAFLVDAQLAQNKWFLFSTMMCVLWGGTFLNCFDIKTSSRFSTIGVISGTLLPGTLIIGLGLYWFLSGHPLAMPTGTQALLPEMQFDNLVFFSGVLLGFGGMEIASFHAQNAINPQRNYPRAILTATIIILFISILGSLAIASVLPKHEISLIAGLMQAFQVFFAAFHCEFLVPIVALLTLMGAFALLNTWIISPCRGLHAAAEAGDLPKIFRYTNRHGSPVVILLSQGLIGSLLAMCFIFMDTVNQSFWILTAMASQLILMMYVVVFASNIKLRYSQPNTVRNYKIPGGKIGVWLVSGTGLFSAIGVIILGFVPPREMHLDHIERTIAIQAALIIAFAFLPMLRFKFRKV